MGNFEFVFDDQIIDASTERNDGVIIVTVGESQHRLMPIGENLFSTTIDGRKTTIAAVAHKGTTYIDIDSVLLEVTEPSDDSSAGGAAGELGAKDKILAPMPGKIVKLLVEVGQEVEEKQQMVIVEAMKMENVVIAKAKGTVKAINFSEGDQVDTETPIIELDLPDEE